MSNNVNTDDIGLIASNVGDAAHGAIQPGIVDIRVGAATTSGSDALTYDECYKNWKIESLNAKET